MITPKPVLLSTGSTLLNLACSGKAKGGIAKGMYTLIVGDSSAGKTWLGRSMLAEASVSSAFKDYRLIHDDVENGAWMDIAKFFGTSLAERIEPPRGTREEPEYSRTVEDFYYGMDDLFDTRRPFIYLLDSENALSSKEGEKQFAKEKAAYEKDKDTSGDYGTQKAKFHSENLRPICNRLKESGSILAILSQTRENIGKAGPFAPSKKRSGGMALKFFCHMEFWLSVREDLKKKVRDKDRQIGILSRIKIEKNRLTGREGIVEVPIYWSYGIDDVGSCVDYLVEEKHWKKTQGKINAKELELNLGREQLVAEIQEGNRERELRTVVSQVFNEIQEACSIQRKSKYE